MKIKILRLRTQIQHKNLKKRVLFIDYCNVIANKKKGRN